MRLVVQRVTRASVTVEQARVASIGRGFLILCGVGRNDTEADAVWLARKTAKLRIFEDADGKMNLSLDAVSGEILVVSQFTLYGDCRKGNRPSYIEAADPETGARLYERYVDELRALGFPVQTGIFRAMMDVELVNDGPVTLWLDSADKSPEPG
jgi:D-tyrosyl-tRNA(Tyr) deacylase